MTQKEQISEKKFKLLVTLCLTLGPTVLAVSLITLDDVPKWAQYILGVLVIEASTAIIFGLVAIGAWYEDRRSSNAIRRDSLCNRLA